MNAWSKSSNEELSVSFDTSWSLATGDTLDSISVAVYDSTGTDVSVDMVDGTATISGTTIVQKFIGGDAGETYTAIFTITTESEEILEESLTIYIEPANPPQIPTGSYVTETEATAYISAYKLEREREPWITASIGERNIALSRATRAIDRLPFKGVRSTTDQAHAFPRGDDTEVPNDIKYACAELALALLDGRDPSYEFENLVFTSKRFGNVSTTSSEKAYRNHIVAGIPSYDAWVLLVPYLKNFDSFDIGRVD
jgi:hypothetical protein